MRMLITIFSFLFILGVHNTAHTAVTYDDCSAIKDQNICNKTAGCYYFIPTNPGLSEYCSSCPGGYYKGTTGISCIECPSDGLYTGMVGNINAVMIDKDKGGLTSVDECAWKSFCHNKNQYLTDFRKGSAGCVYCQARNKPEKNEYYYLYSTSSQTGTLGDATTDYFDKFCGKCGKNTQETKNGDTSCKCITGYVADNITKDTETRVPGDDCEPEEHTITYYCNVGETAVSLFTQSYSDIGSPCYEKGKIADCPSNTESPDYETCKKKHIHFLKYDDRFFIPSFLSKQEVTKGDKYQTYDHWCVDYYDPKPSDSCKKTGHAIIGWYSEKQKVAFATRGSTTDITSVLGTSYTIHSDQLTYKWTDNLDLYPIWKQKEIDCNSGYYLNNKTETCAGCPAGYYCPGVSDGTIDAENPKNIGLYPCPFGSTSDPNSDAITKCHLEPGATKFCGASTGDCIYMPVSAERAYYTNPTETSDE